MRLLVILMSGTLLAGCGLSDAQRSAVKEFGDATAAFGKTAASEVPAMRSGLRDMYAAKFTIADIPGKFNATESTPWLLTGRFTADAAKDRVSAAAGLAAYGAALVELTGSTAPADAAASVVTIGKSLGDVPSFSNSADRLKAVGAGLGALTGLLLEEARLRALRDTVSAADDFVQVAVAMLSAEFKTEDCPASGCSVAYDYRSTSRTLAAAVKNQEVLMRSRPAGDPQRQAILQAAVLAQRHGDAAEAMPSSARKALAKIAEQHTAMKAMLVDPNRGGVDMTQLVSAVQAFATAGLAIKRD